MQENIKMKISFHEIINESFHDENCFSILFNCKRFLKLLKYHIGDYSREEKNEEIYLNNTRRCYGCKSCSL